MTWFELLTVGAVLTVVTAVVSYIALTTWGLIHPESDRRRETRIEVASAVRRTMKVWLPLTLWLAFVGWLAWNGTQRS